jgi:cation/acetate symporter
MARRLAVVMFLSRAAANLARYTFADVVAARLRQVPVRVASAVGSLAVIAFYLIAQMVGAGNLIRLLFGLPYEAAVVIVGVVMLAYVLFGGMTATTWVQIVKAVLLLGGATCWRCWCWRVRVQPAGALRRGRAQYGDGVLSPGRLVSDPVDAISLGLALMLGTAGLPHILMRFYTVPDAQDGAHVGRLRHGLHRLLLPAHVRARFGAMVIIGRQRSPQVDAGGNMAAPLLAAAVGGTAFFGFISAVAFATILAVVAGLTLSGAATLSHDLWVNVVRTAANSGEELWWRASPRWRWRVVSIVLGILFKGQNVAYMVGLAFAIAASANFPVLVLSIFWSRLTTAGAQASTIVGTVAALVLI